MDGPLSVVLAVQLQVHTLSHCERGQVPAARAAPAHPQPPRGLEAPAQLALQMSDKRQLSFPLVSATRQDRLKCLAQSCEGAVEPAGPAQSQATGEGPVGRAPVVSARAHHTRCAEQWGAPVPALEPGVLLALAVTCIQACSSTSAPWAGPACNTSTKYDNAFATRSFARRQGGDPRWHRLRRSEQVGRATRSTQTFWVQGSDSTRPRVASRKACMQPMHITRAQILEAAFGRATEPCM